MRGERAGVTISMVPAKFRLRSNLPSIKSKTFDLTGQQSLVMPA